jgi:uncharacterized membrane protein
MKKIESLMVLLLTLMSTATSTFAQAGDDGSGAACGVLGCGIVLYLLVIAAMLAISITIIVLIYRFIKRDATARGMTNASTMAWLALLGLLGLLIYLLQRPQGNLMPCPSCGQNRMQGLPRCPHCGNP